MHSSLLTCPGNFEDLEDKRSFDVQVGSGISAGFIKLLHRHSAPTRAEEAAGVPLLRDPAVLQAHMGVGPGGLSTTWVIEDSAAQPSIAVTLPPAHPPYGQMAMLRTGGRPWPGCHVKAEVTVTPRAIMGYEVEAKHAGPDFHAVASLVSTDAITGSLLYHQAVTPQVTLGGGLTAGLARVLPHPLPAGDVAWRAFGSWHDVKGDTWALAGYDGAKSALSARVWRQAHESLALGADFRLQAAQDWPSVAGVGARYELGAGGAAGGGAAPVTLTAHVNTNLKSSLSVATSNSAMSQQISSTAMFTTLSGSFDHPKQEFTVGVQLQFQG